MLTETTLDGSTSNKAVSSCAALTPGSQSGKYWINPTGNDAFQAWCDFDHDNKGWTAVLHSYYMGSLPGGESTQSFALHADNGVNYAAMLSNYNGHTHNSIWLMSLKRIKALTEVEGFSARLRFAG